MLPPCLDADARARIERSPQRAFRRTIVRARALDRRAALAWKILRRCLLVGGLHGCGIAPRLAKQLGVPSEHPIVSGVIRGLTALDVCASLLAVRGATNAVCTGARMQTPGAVCRFCGASPESIPHYAACPIALRLFSTALRRPPVPNIIHLLETDPPADARIWAAFIDFVSVAVATERDVVARSELF